MNKCSNLCKLLRQNIYRQKAYSLAWSASNQGELSLIHTYSTLRGGQVRNVPDVCDSISFASITITYS